MRLVIQLALVACVLVLLTIVLGNLTIGGSP